MTGFSITINPGESVKHEYHFTVPDETAKDVSVPNASLPGYSAPIIPITHKTVKRPK